MYERPPPFDHPREYPPERREPYAFERREDIYPPRYERDYPPRDDPHRRPPYDEYRPPQRTRPAIDLEIVSLSREERYVELLTLHSSLQFVKNY